MENMELWNKVCKTNPNEAKPVTISKRNITTIDAQFQRKRATEIFGPYGIGWGVVPESERLEFKEFADTTLVSYFSTMFYILDDKEGRIPINASIRVAYLTDKGKGYLFVDDEYTKKVQTNAITKGLSTLGFNSDVFEGKFDDDKYVQEMKSVFYYIDEDQISTIGELIVKTKTNLPRFLELMKAESMQAIPRTEYKRALAALKSKVEK